MKKLITLILTFVLILTAAVLPACKKTEKSTASFSEILDALVGGGTSARPEEDIDQSKSILHVANFHARTGNEWLENTIARFEEIYADVSFEVGKVGVEVIAHHDKIYTSQFLGQMPYDPNALYFVDSFDYYQGVATGMFKDLSDVITESCYGESESIYDIMDEEKINALSINGKIYAVPHYEEYPGIAYDATLFENENLYFSDNVDVDGTRTFITDNYKVKSCGPNGEYGDSDDGLPSSIEEFLKLIDEMKVNGITPIVVSKNLTNYTAFCLLQAFASNLLGKEKLYNITNLNAFNMEITTGFDAYEMPITETVNINENNAYLFRQAPELYYALEVLKKTFDGAEVNEQGQENEVALRFLTSGLELNDTPIAMMPCTSGWNNHATLYGIYDQIDETYYEIYDKDIRFMYLPVQALGTVTVGNGKAQTLTDANNSYAVINANADEVQTNIAKEFLKFCYSESELNNFTKDTKGILKAVNYSLVEETKACLNNYAQSVIQVRLESDFSYLRSATIASNQTQELLSLKNMQFWGATIEGRLYQYPMDAFKQAMITTKDYFLGMWITQNDWENRR